MSRKPTAISLDTPKKTKPEPKRTSKPAQVEKVDKPVEEKAKSESKMKAASSSSQRKPRAMKAPKLSPSPELEVSTADPLMDEIPNHLPASSKKSRWGVLFLGSISALITLGLGLWFTQVIEGLFARNEWLGWGATALLAVALLCLVVIILREILGLWRLRKLAQLREEVMRALEDKSVPAKKTLDRIAGLYVNRKDMHWHLSRLAAHRDDVMDDRDRLLLAEGYLMKPLDDEAKQIIASAAKRISVVTAVNPAPSLDVLFTGYQILSMLRKLTTLYGNRPGSIGTAKLAGMVGSHLTVTGGLALSDTFLQQFLGKGLAGRLSAKLGEGTVNGIMTARIGIAALDLCRPMPFRQLQRPGLKEFISTIAGSLGSYKEPVQDKD